MLVLTRSIGERLIIGDGEICLHVSRLEEIKSDFEWMLPGIFPYTGRKFFSELLQKRNPNLQLRSKKTKNNW